MADQLRWWKLWTSVMTDGKIRALALEDVARWCLLGALIRQDGESGAIVSRRPHDGLRTLWRQQRVTAVEATLQRLPGLTVETVETAPDGTPIALRITMRNWHKYQEDSSKERTRRWRENQPPRDGQPTVTRDGPGDGQSTVTGSRRETEQTRRDETVPPISPPSQDRDQHARDLALIRDAWHWDCPDKRWRGRCVSRDYALAHPDAGLPVIPDGHGGYMPRECPDHRAPTVNPPAADELKRIRSRHQHG